MNVLSLFDGISCGRVALERLGINPNNYFASEIDKFAIKCTQANYPDTIQLGDVRGISRDLLVEYEIDIIFAGFPCPSFSNAGKKKGFTDERGKLFYEAVRLLSEFKPKFFIFENVKMKAEYRDIISEILGVKPTLINSALVSAQNRERYYWVGILNQEGGYDPLQLPQPTDKEIFLKDILEHDCCNFKCGEIERFVKSKNSNSLCKQVAVADLKGNETIKRVYSPDGKSPTLTTMGGGHREPKIHYNAAGMRGRRLNKEGKRKDYDKTIPITQYLEVKETEKSNCLSTVQKDSLISILTPGQYIAENVKQYYRKLIPLECERLQTLPDDYTAMLSNTQRYKTVGNGWTVDVIAHILSRLFN